MAIESSVWHKNLGEEQSRRSRSHMAHEIGQLPGLWYKTQYSTSGANPGSRQDFSLVPERIHTMSVTGLRIV